MPEKKSTAQDRIKCPTCGKEIDRNEADRHRREHEGR